MNKLGELLNLYQSILPEIKKRVSFFESIWNNGKNEDFFKEMVFCLLTPQSKALSADRVVQELFSMGERFIYMNEEEIREIIRKNGVRFSPTKARYIVLAREKFFLKNVDIKGILEGFLGDEILAREYFVKEVLGFGYKEASHFLRNVGFAKSLSILDRHILNSLLEYGVIDSVPASMSKKVYLEIESRMREFAKTVGIDILYLDFVFWYKKTSFVFK